MKKKYLLIFLIIYSLIFGCSNDSSIELSGNYFYREEGSNVKQIISHTTNRKEIYSKVIDYDYNKDFIIAVQQPDYKDYIIMIAFNLRDDTIRFSKKSLNDNLSEEVADSILKNDSNYKKIFLNKLNYWIISNKENRVYGPLTKYEYLDKRKDLKIANYVKVHVI
jgi:hypothetical protein